MRVCMPACACMHVCVQDSTLSIIPQELSIFQTRLDGQQAQPPQLVFFGGGVLGDVRHWAHILTLKHFTHGAISQTLVLVLFCFVVLR